MTAMCFSKGRKMIAVEQFPEFEKRPGLYIGEGTQLLKVASFGSEEKARLFIEMLKEFFGDMIVHDRTRDGDDNAR